MIAALNGCGCSGPCDHEQDVFLGELGQDGIDLSTIDFGAPQPVVPSVFENLAPSSFPGLDTGTILEPSNSFIVGSDPLSYLNNPLPTNLPPADLSATDTSLMPTPTPISVPGSGDNTAADIAAAAGASAAVIRALQGKPAPPPGYTYNAAGQVVPVTAVPAGYTRNAAGQLVPISSGFSLASAENWLTGKTLISSLPNWAVVGGGVAGVMLLARLADSGGSRRRR